jgi:hypothetical protein
MSTSAEFVIWNRTPEIELSTARLASGMWKICCKDAFM